MQQLTMVSQIMHKPRQALLGTRTTRMLSLDLSDLEREVAKSTTDVFDNVGLSVPRSDLELGLSDGLNLPATPIPRLELAPGPMHWFPSQCSRINTLMADRLRLLRRLMAKSKDWELALARVCGNLDEMYQISSEFMNSEEGEKAFVEGNIIAAAKAAGAYQLISTSGALGNPWRTIEEDPDQFNDPMFLDAMFSEGVELDGVQRTRDYKHLFPWLLDDVDELKVAQWVYELTGMSPWAGSWENYLLCSGKIDASEWPLRQQVLDGARSAASERQRLISLSRGTTPHQPVLEIRP